MRARCASNEVVALAIEAGPSAPQTVQTARSETPVACWQDLTGGRFRRAARQNGPEIAQSEPCCAKATSCFFACLGRPQPRLQVRTHNYGAQHYYSSILEKHATRAHRCWRLSYSASIVAPTVERACHMPAQVRPDPGRRAVCSDGSPVSFKLDFDPDKQPEMLTCADQTANAV